MPKDNVLRYRKRGSSLRVQTVRDLSIRVIKRIAEDKRDVYKTLAHRTVQAMLGLWQVSFWPAKGKQSEAPT